jgi:uncharacterized phage protein (TIGR02216 family)
VKLERLLGYSVTVLRLDPQTFWRIGFREFLSILNWLTPEKTTPSRSDLADLLERFPDDTTTKENTNV